MDIERAMEFILEQQARSQAMLAEVVLAQKEAAKQAEEAARRDQQAAKRSEEAASRADLAEKRMDRLEHVVARLARLGVKSRSRINGRLDEHERRIQEHERWLADQKLLLHEIGEKLNALIDVIDRWPRNPAA